jgi:hypothetical protein
MNPILKKVILFFVLCAGFSVQGQTIVDKAGHIPLIPLKVGNYWIYSNSNHLDKNDTIRVIRTKEVGLYTAYVFDGELVMESGDTIYNFQYGQIRDSPPFRCREYCPSEKENTYNIVIGGDMLGHRSVTKIYGLYKVNNKEYRDCYEFNDGMKRVVISRGIGIIERTGSSWGGIADQYLLKYEIY